MSILLAQELEKCIAGLVHRPAWKRTFGVLYGLTAYPSSDTVILMCAFCHEATLQDADALQAFLEQNCQLLPTGLIPVGILDLLNTLHSKPNAFAGLIAALGNQALFPDRMDPVILSLSVSTADDGLTTSTFTGSRVDRTDCSLKETSVSIKSNETLQRFYTCFHLNAQLDSALTPIHSKHGAGKALELKLLELQVESKEDFAYGLADNALLLLPSSPSLVVPTAGVSITATTKIPECLAALAKRKDKSVKTDGPAVKQGPALLSDATGGILPNEPVALNLFYNASHGKSHHGSSPLLTIGQGNTHLIRFHLDAYIFLSNEKTLVDLAEAADVAKKRRLAGMVDFLRQSSSKSDEIHGLPIPYHIANGPNLLSLYSETNGNHDSSLGELYERFGFEKDAPLLRKEASLRNRLSLARKNLLNVGDRLLNHNNSKFLGEGAAWQLNKVFGAYTYHHYKQDRFDDDGWGCAYRSLQTLFSWFKLQGFTDAPIPNHEQIQRRLVEIKDREKSLIGSKQWIGATEIARVLEHLLQVQCRIVYVPSGRDLGSAFAALKNHFDTEGTPVMIGGGVYAYTIGGVAVNRTTGEVKALVIDPHYVGEDDLDLIFKKNGVAWRTPDFWDQNAFYNLCCPLRPKLP